MHADAFLVIVVLGVLVSVIMTVYNWHSHKNTLFLSSFLIILCLEAYTSWHYHSEGNPFIFALLFNHVAPLYTLKAPLIYFFIRGNIRDQFGFSLRDSLHFLPALIHFLLIIPYVQLPFAEKQEIANLLITQPELYSLVDLKYPYPHIYNLYFRSFQLILYTTLSFSLLIRFKSSIRILTGELKKIYQFSANWLITLMIVFTLMALLQILMVVQIPIADDLRVASHRATSIFEAGIVVYLLIPVILIAYPRFLYGFPSFKVQRTVRVNSNDDEPEHLTAVPGSYSSRVFQNLEAMSTDICLYMEKEKPFLKTDFKMVDIAIALNIPLHHVQLCISMQFGKKFTDFKNEYRIDYARQLMLHNVDNLSIESIGRKSGFVSDAVFYDSFRAITGMTPRQWYEMEIKN
jgi:AraC-like DNA-binding protein